VKFAWESLLQDVQKHSELHHSFSASLDSKIVQPLDFLAKDLKGKLQSLMFNGTSLLTELRKKNENLKKIRETYLEVAQEQEAARKALEKAKKEDSKDLKVSFFRE
jgi:hypothetical protein